ncbi:MAG: tetratricopeptide repeat protein [Terracidiphilus sp.]
MADDRTKKWWTLNTTWLVVAFASLVWWAIAAQGDRRRLVLIIALSLASFAVGCVVGFLFTSYGEESGTVGKIRDWLIAGILGITVAKASSVKGLLVTFEIGDAKTEFALVTSIAVIYTVIGFFFMYFQRELILNVQLAQSRAERGRVEGTQQAGQVIVRFLAALPPSLISGIDDIDEITEVSKGEAENLKKLLYSDDVNKFLSETDRVVKSGAGDWDITSKAAYLHYYRTYYEKDEKKLQAQKAADWILRALSMNPQHVDLTLKYADTLGILERYDEAVSMLERLVRTADAPAYTWQWLGYYLLYVDREDDAVRYSEEYHRLFPDESDTFFNIACAYAQKYCRGVRCNASGNELANNRQLALKNLKEALRCEPEMAETVREKYSQKGESFDCLANDDEYLALVGRPKPAPEDQAKTEKL